MPAEGRPDARFRQCRGLRDLRYRQPGSVDPVKPDTLTLNFERVAVDNAGLAGNVALCAHG